MMRSPKKFDLGFAPWIVDPDPPDRMSTAAIVQMVNGFARLCPELVLFDPDQPRDDHPNGRREE
jgi:hypothetical protein